MPDASTVYPLIAQTRELVRASREFTSRIRQQNVDVVEQTRQTINESIDLLREVAKLLDRVDGRPPDAEM